MNTKLFTFIVLAAILASTSSLVGAAITFGHSADQILLSLNGERTLQEAISLNLHSAPAVLGCPANACFNGVLPSGQPNCVEIITFDEVGNRKQPIAKKVDAPSIYEFTGNEVFDVDIYPPDAEIYTSNPNGQDNGPATSSQGLIKYTVKGQYGVGSCIYSYQDPHCTIASDTLFSGRLGLGSDKPQAWNKCFAEIKRDIESQCGNVYTNPTWEYSNSRMIISGGYSISYEVTTTVTANVTSGNNGDESQVDERNQIDTNDDQLPDIIDIYGTGYYSVWDLEYDWDGIILTDGTNYSVDAFEGYSDEEYVEFDNTNYANMQYVNIDAFRKPVKVDSNNDGIVDEYQFVVFPGKPDQKILTLTNINWNTPSYDQPKGDLDPTGTGEHSINVIIEGTDLEQKANMTELGNWTDISALTIQGNPDITNSLEAQKYICAQASAGTPDVTNDGIRCQATSNTYSHHIDFFETGQPRCGGQILREVYCRN